VLVFTVHVGARTRSDIHQLLPLLRDLHDATGELIDRLTDPNLSVWEDREWVLACSSRCPRASGR
jgi:hypothetical protein